MMKLMRNCLGLLVVLLNATLFNSVVPVTAVNAVPRFRKPVRTSPTNRLRLALNEKVRRAQAAAEQAQEEARSARLQSEALREQLTQLAQELAALRQSQQQTDCSTQIAELTNQVRKLQANIPAGYISVTVPETPAAIPASVSRAAGTPATEERLAELEDQVEINTAQLKEHAQTKVETEQKFRLRLFGALIANTYFNSNAGSLEDVPLYASPPATDPSVVQRNNLGATLRQTKIGLALTGPRVVGARLSAEAEFDFWGGGYDEVLGSLRLRTASARLDWEKTGVEVGLLSPMISPRNPNSLAAVWFAPLAGAGNLWQWRPQLNVEHRFKLGKTSKLIAQGGLLPTFGESISGQTLEGPPAVQARVAWQHGLDNDKQVEVGFGTMRGSKRFGFGRNLGDYVIASDWQIPLGSRVELSGEAYHGRSVNLSEGSGWWIDRLYAFNGPPSNPDTLVRGVRSSGGWLQLSVEARRTLQLNFAYGQEDPNNADIRFGAMDDYTRLKNQVGSANFIYKLRSNFVVSLEYRRLWTNYPTGQYRNNHVNLAVGYLF
jgi:hypothetical protein